MNAPRLAREGLREWLEREGLAVADMLSLIIAVNEAVINSVEHAYPDSAHGDVNLHAEHARTAEADHSRITVTVTDHGRWRDQLSGLDHQTRGITLMHALLDTAVEDTPEGTRVTLVSSYPPKPHRRRRALGGR